MLIPGKCTKDGLNLMDEGISEEQNSQIVTDHTNQASTPKE